jgi:hypothetical protein
MKLKDYIEKNEINPERWFKDLCGYRVGHEHLRYETFFRRDKREYIKIITGGNVSERDFLEMCYRSALENKRRAKHELALACKSKKPLSTERNYGLDAAVLGEGKPN